MQWWDEEMSGGFCVCVSSYTQGRWEGNNVSVLTHEPYHHIWKSWWGDLTGLFFWKPVLINVIELDFPRGGGYPKVGGQGNGYIQERTWGFLKKGMGMAAEKGNGGMKQMKDKVNKQGWLVPAFEAAFRGRINLGWYMMTKWFPWRSDTKFGTLRDVKVRCGQTCSQWKRRMSFSVRSCHVRLRTDDRYPMLVWTTSLKEL